MSETEAYPSGWAADVVLSDGGTAHLRPIRPDDASALVEFHSRLSSDTVYFRFFSPHPTLTNAEVERFTTVDYVDRMALVAELDEQIIGVARYDREDGTDEAEAAFVVADEHQGRGLGSLLLEHLAAAARAARIVRLTATVLPTNQKMLGVFRDAGFVRTSRFDEGVVSVVLDIAPTPAWQLAVDERDRRASVRSIERLLRPRSVAVIGASREPGTVGHAIFANVLAGGFEGAAYPVNAATKHVSSIRAYSTVAEIADEVDLAIVAVPADQVDDVVASCGAKGVKSVIIVSGGFADVGDAEHERRVVDLAHSHGMRLVGPNCIGIVNTAPDVQLHATFARARPPAGRIAFSSQSGALGMTVLQDAARLGLGLSTFVSVGNKADVSGNDLIQFWEQDENTDVVLLYLESFGNP
ncbi:MAG: GNAT family N-acetyltransferase, partial [Acidimicrobiia bacterium]